MFLKKIQIKQSYIYDIKYRENINCNTCLAPIFCSIGVDVKHAVLMLGLVAIGAAELSLSTAISFWFCTLFGN